MSIFDDILQRLQEALPADDILDIYNHSKKLGIDITKRIDGKYDDWFDGQDVVYLDIDSNIVSPLYKETKTILDKLGYTVKWNSNIASKRIIKTLKNGDTKEVVSNNTITAILNNIDDSYFHSVKSSGKYNKQVNGRTVPSYKPDSGLGAGDNDADKKARFIRAVEQHFSISGETKELNNIEQYKIAISRHNFDIARQSYKQIWDAESCKRLTDGGNRSYIPREIKEGVLIAYVIHNDDLSIDHPILRSLIIPYVEKNGTDIYMKISDRKYPLGKNIKGFTETVQNWLDVKQGKKGGLYCINPHIYKDNNPLNITKMDDIDNIEKKLKMLGLTKIQ